MNYLIVAKLRQIISKHLNFDHSFTLRNVHKDVNLEVTSGDKILETLKWHEHIKFLNL